MGVELAATLRFGGKRMLLKDVLELCVGILVELDQQLEEPVDLLLDGRLVARGVSTGSLKSRKWRASWETT